MPHQRAAVFVNLDGGLCDSLLRTSLMVRKVSTLRIDEARERGEITKARQIWLHFHELLGGEHPVDLAQLIKNIVREYRVYPGIFKTRDDCREIGVGMIGVTNATETFLKEAIAGNGNLRGFDIPHFANNLIFAPGGAFWGLEIAASSESMIDKGAIVRQCASKHNVRPMAAVGDGVSDISMAEAVLEFGGIVVACGVLSPLAEWCHANRLEEAKFGEKEGWTGRYIVVGKDGFSPEKRRALTGLIPLQGSRRQMSA